MVVARKIWIITLPAQLKEDVRIYGIRNNLKIWETVNQSVTQYLDSLKSGIELVESSIKYDKDNMEVWSIQIDPEYYKKLKVLGIERDTSLYDLINTALYRFVH